VLHTSCLPLSGKTCSNSWCNVGTHCDISIEVDSKVPDIRDWLNRGAANVDRNDRYLIWRCTDEHQSTYFLLEDDEQSSWSAVMPMSCQCWSSLFLKVFTDGASMTDCSSLFHSLMAPEVKKFCQTVVRYLGLSNFNERRLRAGFSTANSAINISGRLTTINSKSTRRVCWLKEFMGINVLFAVKCSKSLH